MTDRFILRARFTAYDEWNCPMCGEWHYVEDHAGKIYAHTCRLGMTHEAKSYRLPRVAFHAVEIGVNSKC